jgi:hypothetical protein
MSADDIFGGLASFVKTKCSPGAPHRPIEGWEGLRSFARPRTKFQSKSRGIYASDCHPDPAVTTVAQAAAAFRFKITNRLITIAHPLHARPQI